MVQYKFYRTSNRYYYKKLCAELLRLHIPFSVKESPKGCRQFDFDLNEKDLKAVRGLIYQITGGNKI